MKGKFYLYALFGIVAISTFMPSCSQERKQTFSVNEKIKEIPFDESMGKSKKEFQLIFANNDDSARYARVKTVYEKNIPSKVTASKTPKIPKIIHQIWIGPKIPPAYFNTLAEKVKALHPDWEYHLWNDESLADLKLDNWDIVEKSKNWAEKSDIIRCSLLDRFGGVYMDEDVEIFSALDELHEKYDFYAGMEFPHKVATTNNRVWVGISIMASKPGHPIMKNWKRRIRNGWDKVDSLFSSQIERVVNHTFMPFTHAVLQEIDQPGNTDILFPATYFYPLAFNYAAKRRGSVRAWREKLYDFLEVLHLKNPRAYSRIYPESIGVHYWGNTWLPNDSMQLKDLYIALDGAKKELYTMQKKVRAMEERLASSENKVSEMMAKKTDAASQPAEAA